MTKIKICGLTRPVDIEMVNKVLPDYIGFVFAKSRRQVTEETAKQLKQMLDPSIRVVGVFVNEDINTIIRLSHLGIIDVIQLHGDETEDYLVRLREAVPDPIIKAVRVRGVQDIMDADRLSCDYLLLDTYKGNQYGGSGEVFDWSVIIKTEKPVFLAGGIHPDNVQEAIHQVNPFCIDVSSGVETNGWKDNDKIVDMITKVRSVR